MRTALSAGEATARGAAGVSKRTKQVAAGTSVNARSAQPAGIRPHQNTSSTAEQLLADYYAGKLRPAQPAAAGSVVKEASAQRFPWAKPEWGRYRQRAVIYADPEGAGQFTIWAWDIMPEVGLAAPKALGGGCLADVFTHSRHATALFYCSCHG
jgi:hypothetical protein